MRLFLFLFDASLLIAIVAVIYLAYMAGKEKRKK